MTGPLGLGIGIGLNQRRRRGSSFTLPSITSFSVGPQDGGELPATLEFAEGTDPPQDVFLIGVAAGGPDISDDPNGAQVIIAGEDANGDPAPIFIHIENAQAGPADFNIDPTPTTGGYDYFVVVVDSEGRPSNVASALGVTWEDPSAGAVVEYAGKLTAVNNSGPTVLIGTATISAVPASATRKVFAAIGVHRQGQLVISGFEVDGVAATIERQQTPDRTAEIFIISATVPSGDTALITMTADTSNTLIQGTAYVWVTDGLSVAQDNGVEWAATQSGLASFALSDAQSGDFVIMAVNGHKSTAPGPTPNAVAFTNVVEETSAFQQFASEAYTLSAARAAGVSTGPLTVSAAWQNDGSTVDMRRGAAAALLLRAT